jgi:tryptophan-rich sensory protein
MPNYNWYSQLLKPTWAPPAWIFGPVWTVLYCLIAVSFGKVFIMFFQKQIPFIVLLPFILNLIFNLAFTPIQFGLKNNYLAALDILLVLGTLIWAIIAIWPHLKWVAYIQTPYLIWVSFATILQLTVTYLNK